jgi:hypothetical protein
MAKSKTKPDTPKTWPVEALAADLPAWELAALRRAARWAEGKQVSEAEFTAALDQLRNRPQGGGRL